MSVVEQIEALRDAAEKQKEAADRGGNLAGYQFWSGRLDMADRVLALLDGAVELEGWANLDAIQDEKIAAGCVLVISPIQAIFPDVVRLLILPRKPDA